jgi:hypothetical protein
LWTSLIVLMVLVVFVIGWLIVMWPTSFVLKVTIVFFVYLTITHATINKFYSQGRYHSAIVAPPPLLLANYNPTQC